MMLMRAAAAFRLLSIFAECQRLAAASRCWLAADARFTALLQGVS